MNIYSIHFAIGSVGIAYLACAAIGKVVKNAVVPNKYASIDGLRGYLAFLVFLCHTVGWCLWLKSGTWETPRSTVFATFGRGSVALFFMVTALLFWGKVIDSKHKPMNWKNLYLSRIFRITPVLSRPLINWTVFQS